MTESAKTFWSICITFLFFPYNYIIFRIFPDFYLCKVKVEFSSCRTLFAPTFCFLTTRRRCLKQWNFVVLILFRNALHAGSLSQTFSKARSLRFYRSEDIKCFHEWYYVKHKYIALIWTNYPLFYQTFGPGTGHFDSSTSFT